MSRFCGICYQFDFTEKMKTLLFFVFLGLTHCLPQQQTRQEGKDLEEVVDQVEETVDEFIDEQLPE